MEQYEVVKDMEIIDIIKFENTVVWFVSDDNFCVNCIPIVNVLIMILILIGEICLTTCIWLDVLLLLATILYFMVVRAVQQLIKMGIVGSVVMVVKN